MTDNRYAAAGWAAILSAAATLAVLGLSFVFELSQIVETRERFTPTIWRMIRWFKVSSFFLFSASLFILCLAVMDQWEDSSLPWQNPAATGAQSGRARRVLSFHYFEIKRNFTT